MDGKGFKTLNYSRGTSCTMLGFICTVDNPSGLGLKVHLCMTRRKSCTLLPQRQVLTSVSVVADAPPPNPQSLYMDG